MTLPAILVRWLPLALIIVLEAGVLVPLRQPLIGGTTWGPFAVLFGIGVSIFMLVDLRSQDGLRDRPLRLRIPNPNGLTIPAYLGQLLYFAIAIAPLFLIPGRNGH